MIQQQIIGLIRLSVPLLVLFNLKPSLLHDGKALILCSLLIGLHILHLNWAALSNLRSTLQYSPNEQNKELFDGLIKECTINPEAIIIKYAYTNESTALAASNIIVVDPIVWCDLDGDSQALQVKDIFATHIEPTLAEPQKKRLADVRLHMTPAVQRFIFKHELGHYSRSYSYYSLAVSFTIAFLMALIGIYAACMILPWSGLAAILFGIAVGGVSDLALTFTSNATWKLHEERMADHFAAKHSSPEDIIAAANFFAQHQTIVDKNPDAKNWTSHLPSEIRTGHPNGKKRAAYLLQLAAQKQSSYN